MIKNLILCNCKTDISLAYSKIQYSEHDHLCYSALSQYVLVYRKPSVTAFTIS